MSSKFCIVDFTEEYNNKLPKYVMEAACKHAKKQISFAQELSLEVVVGKYDIGVFANTAAHPRLHVVQNCILDFIAGWESAWNLKSANEIKERT